MNPETPDNWSFMDFENERGQWWNAQALEFFQRLQRQIDADHVEIRRKNAAKREMFRKSPAMAAADALTGAFGGFLPETEADHDALLRKFIAEMRKDPLLQRYVNYLEYGSFPRPNTEWWHAFGHQQLAEMTVAKALTREEFLSDPASKYIPMPTIWDTRMFPTSEHLEDQKAPLRDVGPREWSFEWTGRLDDAQTYLWTQECLEAALNAPLVPHVVQPNALPFDTLFFSFELAAWHENASTSDWDDNPLVDGAHSETWWLLVTKMGEAGIGLLFNKQLYPHGEGYQPQEHIVFEPILWGMRWPDDFAGLRFQRELGHVLAMLAFMQAPFVDAEPIKRRLGRMEGRRDYERKGSPAPEPAVSIVTLRRRLHEPLFTSPQEGENGAGREYKHSWWVGGHYRWQFYPSTQDHKLIAIAPYMKQIGKPLLPRLHHVAQ